MNTLPVGSLFPLTTAEGADVTLSKVPSPSV